MSLSDNTPPTNKGRAARPERLIIGGEEMVRNDVAAREQGTSERTVNRHDARGAPFVKIGGVKYRPLARYHKFLLDQIQYRNQTSPRRARR